MTTRDRLLDVERQPRERWTGSRALVLLGREVCVRCGGEVTEFTFGQLPLFRSHGQGAVAETTLMICSVCQWTFIAAVTEVNPHSYVA